MHRARVEGLRGQCHGYLISQGLSRSCLGSSMFGTMPIVEFHLSVSIGVWALCGRLYFWCESIHESNKLIIILYLRLLAKLSTYLTAAIIRYAWSTSYIIPTRAVALHPFGEFSFSKMCRVSPGFQPILPPNCRSKTSAPIYSFVGLHDVLDCALVD